MHKTLCIAVLLSTLALTSGGKPADASPTTPPSPVIVARVGLLNQTAAIPQTTVFTPTQSGVYRVSPYLALTTKPNDGFWYFDVYWTDEGGTRSASQMLSLSGDYGRDPNGSVVGSFTFRAIAGQPVSYGVSTCCSAGGTYELFFVVERLM
jgi:hypothetical protein